MGLFGVQPDRAWLAAGFAFIAASYVFFMVLTCLALEHWRYESPENVTLPPREHVRSERDGGGDGEDEQDAVARAACVRGDVSYSYGLAETPRVLQVASIAPHARKNATPVTVAFQDLWYTVPDPANPNESLELLRGVSGFARPGTITALMGSYGAGKTTLMDAATFREALTFSALLRQAADVPDRAKLEAVEDCLALLDLLPIADQIIRGSSVEQMKRLTIGVELAAQPSVLFLDEPTSGLDARSAKVIMDGVRKVADTGRTVVCTIHQPSFEVFQVFDSLLLLKRGGETVYFGELGDRAGNMVRYFERVGGVPPIAEGYNPATWMLDVIGAGVAGNSGGDGSGGSSGADATDFVRVFQASDEKRALDATLARDDFTRPAPGVAAPEWRQAQLVVQRFLTVYWRTPSYNLTRFAIYLVLALVFGLAFTGSDYASYQGINGGEGIVFLSTMFLGVISLNSVMPLAAEERVSFYRERAAQTYNSLWYFVGATVAEVPYVLASTLLFTAVFFPLVGFTGAARFAAYWLVSALTVLLHAYVGQLFVFALPSFEAAAIMGVLFTSIFFLFVGFNPPANAIPAAYEWLFYASPYRYGLAALSAIVFTDCPDPAELGQLSCKIVQHLPPALPQGLNVKGYVETVFKMKHSEIWLYVGVHLAFVAFFRVLAALALRFVNHQKK